MVKPIAIVLALSSLASAVPFRLVTFNIGAHFVGSAPDYSLNSPGTPDHDQVKAILGRINADVVALEEIASADVSGNPDDLDALAASLGYPYIYIAPTSSSGGLTGPFDTTLRNVFLSRHPFITTDSVRSPAGAREMTRLLPVVKVNIPGTTRDPVIMSVHLKSGTARSDRYQRAIEMKRAVGYLNSHGIANDDNFIVLGDFNPSSSNTDFAEEPETGLPNSWVRGADIPLPVHYDTNPLYHFNGTPLSPIKLNPRQTNGSAFTYNTSGASSSTIDLLLVSSALAGRAFSSEIYNSALDTSNSVGLPKTGNPISPDATVVASDHYAVFADFELDENYPDLNLTLTSNTVSENAATGSSKLVVTLPQTATSAVTINLTSNNPAAAYPTSPTLVIPGGSNTGQVDIVTTRNFINDEGASVTFTAENSNFNTDTAILQVTDTDDGYHLTDPGQTIAEDFTSFAGNRDPAPWGTSAPSSWQGVDNGSSVAPGFRSYGPAGNPSLGFLPNSASTAPTTFSATYFNDSSSTLTSTEIAFNARQWRAAFNGTTDQLTAAIVTPAGTIPVPALSYTPATNLPTGAIASPAAVPRSAVVNGLSIAPGQSFDIRFTVTPGSGGGALSSDVFINEFHYDNTSTDEGEFVEVVVGPGFTGSLADLRLYLYNGSDGTTYPVNTFYGLDTFTLGSTTASGHRILYRMIAGIQNGNPDGFALSNGSQPLQFISYGGSFAAANGPAQGMTSTDVGFTQPTSTPVNTNAIRLIGNGNSRADFTWTKTAIAHSPGEINSGQSFTSPSQAQGISVDDISVTFIAPDTDIDTDGDGYSDLVETDLLLTDPNDASSRFVTTFGKPSASGVRLQFPTLAGRQYLVQSSTTLTSWDEGTPYSGNGAVRAIDFPIVPGEPKRFYRVVLSLE